MSDELFFRIAKALADRQRFEIFELISKSDEMSCSEIVQHCAVAQPTVSHHLKVLSETGLVSSRREGQHGFFYPLRARIEKYLDELKRRTSRPA